MRGEDDTIHASRSLWTGQVVFRTTYVSTNTYMSARTISGKEGHTFEGQWGEGFMGEFGGKKRKGEML